MSVRTERKFVVRRQISEQLISCEKCREQMVSAQFSADFFGVSSRMIYRLIESSEIHFAETDANEIYVCPVSVERALKTI